MTHSVYYSVHSQVPTDPHSTPLPPTLTPLLPCPSVVPIGGSKDRHSLSSQNTYRYPTGLSQDSYRQESTRGGTRGVLKLLRGSQYPCLIDTRSQGKPQINPGVPQVPHRNPEILQNSQIYHVAPGHRGLTQWIDQI